MVAIGLAAGGVLSILVVDALEEMLFTVAHADAFSIGVAASVLMATDVGAVLPAALRASRTDPRMVLHGE